MSVTAKTGKKQDARRFQKGQSGNPKGRPQGSRNKVSLAIDELLGGEAEKLTRKAIELAMNGDTVALRLCLERRASGKCPRFNRVKQLRAERLATADAQYCRSLLERYDRKDLNKWVRRGSHGHSMTLFNLLRGGSRPPVIKRLCELHGLDTDVGEEIIERAKQSGRIELTQEIVSFFKAMTAE